MSEFDIVQKALDVVYDQEKRFYNSKWNLLSEVRAELQLPAKVRFVDTTLREGGENPFVIYSPEDKARIAAAIAEIGIAEIDCGHPALSTDHRETVEIIKKAKLGLKVMAVTRLDVGDYHKVIDDTIAAGADVLETSIYGIPVPGCMTRKDYANLIEEGVRYAKNQNVYTAFWIPCTRWDPEFSLELYAAAARGGADRLDYAGTGCISPTTMKHMVHRLKEIAGNRLIGLHCHDHTGVATACAISGVEAGASVVHTSVNGMSDGGGVAAFEEVVMCLEQFYGINTGIQLQRLGPLSRLVQEITRQPVFGWKAIVGNGVFSETADSHLERILLGRGKGNGPEAELARWSAFGMKPEAIGQEISLVFGPASLVGRGIRAKAQTMDINLTEMQLQEITGFMKQEFRSRGAFSENEIGELIRRITEK
jgi:isopropylmalate/homocitrate/citramalate synthase